MAFPVKKSDLRPAGTESEDFRFAAAAAAFGMILRNSPHKGKAGFEMVEQLALSSLGKDEYGYRKDFITLIHNAREAKPYQGER
jgi:Ca-activated chloride channel family protein